MASTTPYNPDVVLAKWLSLDNHVHNVHVGHGSKYPVCSHGRLSPARKWFKRRKFMKCMMRMYPASYMYFLFYIDTKDSVTLTKIITSTHMCKDVRRLSPIHQTSSLEAFHSLILHFAPKNLALSYKGMDSRLVCACMQVA